MLPAEEQAGRSPSDCLSRFSPGPHGGQKQNNPNPTTFLSKTEDRKCEKLWTLPAHHPVIGKMGI